MRLFISGSAPLLEQTHREFLTRTGHRILERYGMTECGMSTSNPLDGERKSGTVGLPLAGVSLRIVDDAGNPAAIGEIGQIEFKGPNVFQGYWRMPDKTAEEFSEDGYFRSGDLGTMDEDGYVSIVGRDKDLIISGGLQRLSKGSGAVHRSAHWHQRVRRHRHPRRGLRRARYRRSSRGQRRPRRRKKSLRRCAPCWHPTNSPSKYPWSTPCLETPWEKSRKTSSATASAKSNNKARGAGHLLPYCRSTCLGAEFSFCKTSVIRQIYDRQSGTWLDSARHPDMVHGWVAPGSFHRYGRI